MDRIGADSAAVVEQVREKLGCDAVLMQLPIGKEADFKGLVDLITMKAVYFDGKHGEVIREDEVPSELVDKADAARSQMLESLSMYSDELMELLLAEEEVPEQLIHQVIENATCEQDLTPVYLGTAYRNKGVQPLLDAITRYLPSPLDREITANSPLEDGPKLLLETNPDKPFVGMACLLYTSPSPRD